MSDETLAKSKRVEQLLNDVLRPKRASRAGRQRRIIQPAEERQGDPSQPFAAFTGNRRVIFS